MALPSTTCSACEWCCANGEVADLGGYAIDLPGYDLPGVFVGSEGTLGIATEIILRIVRKPEAVLTALAAFPHTDAAGQAVSDIIAGAFCQPPSRSWIASPSRRRRRRCMRATPRARARCCWSSWTARGRGRGAIGAGGGDLPRGGRDASGGWRVPTRSAR